MVLFTGTYIETGVYGAEADFGRKIVLLASFGGVSLAALLSS